MARGASTHYPIGSPTRICAASGRALAVGERYVAVLCQQRESDEFVRLDFAEEAWREGARPARTLIGLGSWRGVVGDASARRRPLIDDESLLDLFEQSDEGEGAGSPERLAFRFVLALILLRKRLLVQEGGRDGGRVMLVRPKGTPKPPEGPALVEVVDPGLTPDLVAKVTEQLHAVLAEAPVSGPSAQGQGGGA